MKVVYCNLLELFGDEGVMYCNLLKLFGDEGDVL